MRKLAVLACAFIMAMGLFACSGGSSSSAASGSASASAASVASASSTAASGSTVASSAAASSAAASSAASLAGATDFGWISFQMPDGWVDAKESASYVTIENSANNKQIMKFSERTLMSSAPTTAEYVAGEIAKESNHYTDGGTKTIGAYEWHLANFEFNGNPSVKAYADIAEKKCLQVTIYEMTIDDPNVQQVLSSIAINQSAL